MRRVRASESEILEVRRWSTGSLGKSANEPWDSTLGNISFFFFSFIFSFTESPLFILGRIKILRAERVGATMSMVDADDRGSRVEGRTQSCDRSSKKEDRSTFGRSERTAAVLRVTARSMDFFPFDTVTANGIIKFRLECRQAWLIMIWGSIIGTRGLLIAMGVTYRNRRSLNTFFWTRELLQSNMKWQLFSPFYLLTPCICL